jgi:RNA polymerase sigma-70 factor (ECF subfamily)
VDEATEARILAEAHSGSAGLSRAVSELFVSFAPRFRLLARNLTRDDTDPDDIVQQVFLSVHRALPEFRGEARLDTWLYRIMLRTALAHRAKKRRTTPYADPGSLGDLLVDHRAEDRAVARSEAARVREAWLSLSVEHQIVLSLFAVEGLSHQEISSVLGIPEGTVWSRLSLARRNLNRLLAGPAGASPPR